MVLHIIQACLCYIQKQLITYVTFYLVIKQVMPGKVNQFTCILLLTKAAKTLTERISA